MSPGITTNDIDRAIIGRDLEDFRVRFGLSLKQLEETLSIAPAKRLKYLAAPNEVVDDVAVALTIRMYLRHPELLVTSVNFDVLSWYLSLGGGRLIRKRLFSVLFGRDANTSYRWLDKRTPLTKQMYDLVRLVKAVQNGIFELYEVASAEATYRQVSPFITGSWAKPADNLPCVIPFGDLASTPLTSRRGPKPKRDGVVRKRSLTKPSSAVSRVSASTAAAPRKKK